MQIARLATALALAALLGLGGGTPASAASDGTLCGQVTEFTAPTAGTDGSITIAGTAEVIAQSAFGVIDPDVYAALDGVAAADATTCLEIVTDGSGNIVDLTIAETAEICGVVAHEDGTSEFIVDGVRLPSAVVSADADLTNLLAAAATNEGSACVTVMLDPATALITSVVLTTMTVCDVPTVNRGTTTIAGIRLGLDVWDEHNFLFDLVKIADSVDQAVCADLVVQDGDVVEAALRTNLAFCGDVELIGLDRPSVAGAVLDATITSTGVWELLLLAGTSDSDACVDIVAPGVFIFDVDVTVDEACAEVTGIGDGTITLELSDRLAFDVTLDDPAGLVDSSVQVGSLVCVWAHAGERDGSPILDNIRTVRGPILLPDAAIGGDHDPKPVAVLMLSMAGGIGLGAVVRRLASSQGRTRQ